MVKILGVLTFVAALAAAATLAASGPGSRLDLWPWQVGLQLLRWAACIGLGAAAVALVQLLIPKLRRASMRWLVASLVLGLAAAAPPIYLLHVAKSVPPIHDITTDTADPPVFVSLLPVREKSRNGAMYGGPEVAAAQKRAYPDIATLAVALPPPQAFTKALEAARAEGWEIAAADPAAGRIEATATTAWFGFNDDVIVRVRGADQGSRIDIRSVSRVGRSDVGANARRIREFLARLRSP